MSRWSRLANVFRAGGVDRDLDDEMQFHLEERTRELIEGGMTPAAARAQALRQFGNTLQLREESRSVKLLPWLDAIATDAGVGLRQLIKNRISTVTMLASLAPVIGACLAAFVLLDALVLRPLPVADANRLVYLIFPTGQPERPESDTFNDPTFVRLRDAGRDRVSLFAMSTQVMRTVRFDGGDREPVRTQHVSGNTFEQLGITPAMGRLIAPHDDAAPGASPVAVVSHAFWLRRFGGDPGIVGRTLLLQERQYQIVGVAAARFTGVEPGRPTELWLPYAMGDPRSFGNAGFNWFRIMGRLQPGHTSADAQAILQSAFTAFRGEIVSRLGPDASPERRRQFLSTPLYVRSAANGPSPLRRQFERPLWTLGAIAALVLLVAGSNVANLSLARGAGRAHEMALRRSLGAGGARLIQQVLIESAMLSAAATLLGLGFASLTAPAVVEMLSSSTDPLVLDLRLNWRIAAIATGVAALVTMLFGLAPAVRALRVPPIAALNLRRQGGGARARVMQPLVAMQAGFGVIVLLIGGLLVLSFARVSSVPAGFAASNVLLVSLETVERIDDHRRQAAILDVLDRIGRLPEVRSVSVAEFNLIGRAWTHEVRMPGTAHDTIETTVMPVSHGFFETMLIPLVAGRAFTRDDLAGYASPALIVNEAFARKYYGDQPAVGQVYEGAFFDDDRVGRHEIVGVVANTRYDLRQPAAPVMYLPMPFRNAGTLQVRLNGDPGALSPKVTETVRAASALFRVTSAVPQSTVIDRTLLSERLLALLSSFFAVLGLALAAIGLYGVLSYSVLQRTGEIGVRVALGARPLNVIRSVVGDSGRAVATGAAAGLIAGVYLSRFVETMLFEVRAGDFWSLALPLTTLFAAAAAAAVVPAWRAARIDPAIALRYE